MHPLSSRLSNNKEGNYETNITFEAFKGPRPGDPTWIPSRKFSSKVYDKKTVQYQKFPGVSWPQQVLEIFKSYSRFHKHSNLIYIFMIWTNVRSKEWDPIVKLYESPRHNLLCNVLQISTSTGGVKFQICSLRIT